MESRPRVLRLCLVGYFLGNDGSISSMEVWPTHTWILQLLFEFFYSQIIYSFRLPSEAKKARRVLVKDMKKLGVLLHMDVWERNVCCTDLQSSHKGSWITIVGLLIPPSLGNFEFSVFQQMVFVGDFVNVDILGSFSG